MNDHSSWSVEEGAKMESLSILNLNFKENSEKMLNILCALMTSDPRASAEVIIYRANTAFKSKTSVG